MRKILSKIAGLALGLSLAAGVGVAISSKKADSVHAAEEVYHNMIFNSTNNSKGVSSYSNSWTNTTDGFTWNLTNWNNYNNGWSYIKAGHKSTAYVATISTASAVDKAVTKVDVVINAVTSANINSLKLYYGSSANPTTNETSITVGTGTKTVTIPSGSRAANLYYRLAVDCKAAANGSFTLGDFKLYTEASTSTYTVSFNGNGATGSMASISGLSGAYTLPNNGFSVPSGKAFAGWKAENTGNLIAAGASYTLTGNVTFYAQWAVAHNVTYSAGENGTGTYVHSSQPAGTYTLLPFSSLSGVSASSGYRFKDYTVGGVSKAAGATITLSAATSITVNFELIPIETTYNFVKTWGWGTTYGTKTIDGKTEVSGDYGATIVLARTNIQSSGVGSDRPYLCGNTNADAKMITFTLTESGYKLKDVTITFEQRGSNAPGMKLFKGDTNTGTALDSGTIGSKNTLSATNLNDTVFTVTLNAGGTSNKGVALTSIYISIEPLASFGTLHHITITNLPNVVYHVGETYSPAGLTVIAYDGSDEATANFKDVTESVETDLDNPTAFVDSDVPGFDCDVQYSGDGGTDTKSFHVYVYALAEYELVTSEPSDWSGQYLIVGVHENTNYAMNGAISNLDIEGNHKTVVPDENDVIQNGQELEWTIAAYSTGYSIQGKSGKYIGWSSGSANGLTVSDTALVNTLTLSGSEVSVVGTGGRKLSFNSDGEGRFRYYQSGSVQLYKLKVADNADEYAQLFLGAFTCDSTGENAPTFVIKEGTTYWSWSLLEDEYNNLTAVEKEQFRLGVPSQTGSNIEKALARYDLVVRKYGWDNFMSRTITSGAPYIQPITNNNSSTIIIVVVALTSITSIGVVLVIKRRRSLVK